jgi:hypothetical protein
VNNSYYLITGYRNMVKVKDFPIEVLEKIDPSVHYRHERGYLRDNQKLIFNINSQLGVNEFIELIAEYFLYKWTFDFLTRSNIMEDSDTTYFNKKISEFESLITDFWILLAKNIPDKDQMTSLDTLKMVGLIRFDSFRDLAEDYWKPKIKKWKKQCQYPGCDRVFLASPKNSKYCEKCRKIRNREHVRKYRETHTFLLHPIKCENKNCKKKFTPKTKRARFCSDSCRVQNYRFEIAEIKEGKILMEQIRADREASPIKEITPEEADILLGV